MSSWLDCCEAFACERGLAESEVEALVSVLVSFRSPDPRGGPPPPPEPNFEGDFAALERELAGALEIERIAAALQGEVDEDQARMFGRRLASVDQALTLDEPSERVLRVGLRMRARGIAASSGVRALRLRALADFYYSQHARLRHRAQAGSAPALVELLGDLAWRELEPGLEFATIHERCAEGPVSVNLLRADPSQVEFVARDCRAEADRGRSFAAIVQEAGASAGVSGGFFLYSEPDIEAPCARFDPVGLLLTPGVPLRHPPVFRRGSVLVSDNGGVEIDALGLEGVELELGQRRVVAHDVVNRARARQGPARPSVAIVGDRVVAWGESLPVPLNGFVLALTDPEPIAVGEQVRYGPLRSASGQRLVSGIAGGPMLVREGRAVLDMRGEDFWGSAPPVTFSQDETGDQNCLPRLAAGLDGDGRLVLAAIDGRNLERAIGMTLGEVAAMMIGLGCVVATNLDGGSSKRMVVEGRSVDLATTEVVVGRAAGPQRVRTGLLLFAGRNRARHAAIDQP